MAEEEAARKAAALLLANQTASSNIKFKVNATTPVVNETLVFIAKPVVIIEEPEVPPITPEEIIF